MKEFTLTTKRLLLEPLATKHFETTFVYSTDIENTKMMCFLPCDDAKEVMDYLKKCEIQWQKDRPDYLDAAIILNGTHIGAVSIEFIDNGAFGELGWIINKNYQGNGYAAEAAVSFMNYIKNRFGISHFIAHADGENIPSIRVMEKIGMSFVTRITGRKNRNSDEERTEVLYEVYL